MICENRKNHVYLQPQAINAMPTLFHYLGLQFFFYSNDHEPIHIHISNGQNEARFNVITMELIENCGLKASELKHAQLAIKENQETIISKWNEFFSKN
jgi:hypothetical protein